MDEQTANRKPLPWWTSPLPTVALWVIGVIGIGVLFVLLRQVVPGFGEQPTAGGPAWSLPTSAIIARWVTAIVTAAVIAGIGILLVRRHKIVREN